MSAHPLPDRAGLAVEATGVVHLYAQEGADVVALRGVDLHVEGAEMVALLGPSGMGKSTLLQLLAGLIQPSSGRILLDDLDLGRCSSNQLRELRATEISYVTQETGRNLLPYATAAENVWFAQQGRARRRRAGLPNPLELLRQFGLGDVAQVRVARLPRGLRQQVAMAAGVAPVPRLLLADEPTSQLDSEASAGVVALLRAINQRMRTTVILVTHDPQVAEALPRTITIRDGRIGEEGLAGEQFAVVDGSGSVQLPPDVRRQFPPHTRVRVIRQKAGIELRPVDPEGPPDEAGLE